jgi:carboxymethylenebutenolidase
MTCSPITGLAATLLACTTLVACGGAGDDFVDRMAAEHAGEEPAASPAAQVPPAAEAEGAEVTYATVEGKPVSGYLAHPKGASGAPGIIVIHEWWGLNDNVRAMARRLAGEGYAALAVNLYGGETAATAEEARRLMQASTEHEGALEENLRQAYAYLQGHGAPKIGVIGWCFGGGWSLRTALLLPDKIAATVIFYGRLETDPAKLKPLAMPIIGFFGSEDRGIPVESVRAFEAALKGLGKDVEIHVYQGANHAFANPSGERYDATAAEDAWARTVAFLKKSLMG